MGEEEERPEGTRHRQDGGGSHGHGHGYGKSAAAAAAADQRSRQDPGVAPPAHIPLAEAGSVYYSHHHN